MRATDRILDQSNHRPGVSTDRVWQEAQRKDIIHTVTWVGSLTAAASSLLKVSTPLNIAGISFAASTLSLTNTVRSMQNALTRDIDKQHQLDQQHQTQQAPVTRAAARTLHDDLSAQAAYSALGQSLALIYVAPGVASCIDYLAPNAGPAGQAVANFITSAVGSYAGSYVHWLGKRISERWTERVVSLQHQNQTLGHSY